MSSKSFFLRRKTFALIALTLTTVVVVGGALSRRAAAVQLRDTASAQAVRTVAVASPTLVSGAALELPGRIEAWSRAPIYARVSGYLKRWTVDIGEAVKAGQVLAEIDSPDVDLQLQQAKAEFATASSNAAIAASTARR